MRRRLSILETMRCLVMESCTFNPADVGTDGDADHFWVDRCDGTDRKATGAFSESKKLERLLGRPTLDGGHGIQAGSLVPCQLSGQTVLTNAFRCHHSSAIRSR